MVDKVTRRHISEDINRFKSLYVFFYLLVISVQVVDDEMLLLLV